MPTIRNVGTIDWDFHSRDYLNSVFPHHKGLLSDISVGNSMAVVRLELKKLPPRDRGPFGVLYKWQEPVDPEGFGWRIPDNLRDMRLVRTKAIRDDLYIPDVIAGMLSRDCEYLLMTYPYVGIVFYEMSFRLDCHREAVVTYPTKYMEAFARKVDARLRKK